MTSTPSIATGLLQVDDSRPRMGSEEWKSLANPNYVEGASPEEGGPGFGQGSEDKVDKGHKAGMQTFGENYKGQQDSAGGVLAMLDVIMSDFTNLEADTKAAESQSQDSYDKFMTESKKNRAVKMKKIDMDENDKAAAEIKLQEDTKDMKGTQDE